MISLNFALIFLSSLFLVTLAAMIFLRKLQWKMFEEDPDSSPFRESTNCSTSKLIQVTPMLSSTVTWCCKRVKLKGSHVKCRCEFCR